jgi:hypothetical protein
LQYEDHKLYEIEKVSVIAAAVMSGLPLCGRVTSIARIAAAVLNLQLVPSTGVVS